MKKRSAKLFKKIDNIKNHDISRRIFIPEQLPKDKIICFIASWEIHQFSKQGFTELSNHLIYFANQLYIFWEIEHLYLDGGSFSYYVYRLKKHPTRFEILPINQVNKEYLSEIKNKILDRHRVDVLNLDYQIFYRAIVSEYLKWYWQRDSENYANIKQGNPLLNLFDHMPFDTRTFTHGDIVTMLNQINEGGVSEELISRCAFRSNSHLRLIPMPMYWDQLQKDGYLVEENKIRANLKTPTEKSRKIGNFRFFYSFESLLYFEFYHLLKKATFCKNCGHILPFFTLNGRKYKGKNCPPFSSNYNHCSKARSRERVKRFRTKSKV